MGANQDFDSKPIKVISIRRPESGSDGSLLSAIKKGSIPKASGIYIVHENKKCYVGSAGNLSSRVSMQTHHRLEIIAKRHPQARVICLLTDGDRNRATMVEFAHIDELQPIYNCLRVSGNAVGDGVARSDLEALLHSRSYINELEKEVVRLKEVEADTIEARTRAASLLRYKEKADNGVTEIDRKLAFDRRMKRDYALKDAAITLWDYFQSIGVQLDFGSDLSEAEADYATDDEMSAARRSARIFY